jgi:hypothetical protein
MSSVTAALYVVSGIVLLVVPVLQVLLHRKLGGPGTPGLSRLGLWNHLLLGVAGVSVAGLYYLVDPEANIRVDLLLAMPVSALVVLLWAIFALRWVRMTR